MGRLSRMVNRALSAVGLRRVRNSGIVPGTESYQILKEWIESPLKGAGSLDWDLRNKISSTRRTSRKLALNNPLVRQYLQLLEQNVIGPRGMRLQCQVRNAAGDLDKAINSAIEAAFADFWRSPWVDGRLSGVQGEQLLIRTMAVDGEAFVRRVLGSRFKYGLALQMIDPDLVDHQLNRARGVNGENEIRLGIEVDEWGAAVAIYVLDAAQQDLNGGRAQRRHTRIPASEIIHLYDPERINQSRGITWLNSVALPLNILDGYVEASLVAARTAACSMPLFKHTNTELFSTDASGNPTPQNFTIELNPGGGLTIPPGLEMQEFDPSKPTIGFGEFTKENKRWVSSGVQVSYNALANDLEGVNYSSMRSGLLIERDSWQCLQQMWIDRFRQPVHGWFVPAALLSGNLRLPSRDASLYLAANFVPRGWKWVDPLKDVTAAVLAIKEGLGSRTGFLGEQGEDFEAIAEQLADETDIAASAGITLGEDPQQNQQQNSDKRLMAALRLLLAEEKEA